MPVSVLIAEDHEIVRSGLIRLLKGSEIEIVGEASDGEEAVEETLKCLTDVVLMDIRMSGTDGLEALEQIRQKAPNTRVVMLSTYDNPTYVARSAALGADEYLLKGSSRDQLIDGIRRVANGEPLSDESIMRRVRSTMSQDDEGLNELSLTSRETQVLRHVALGLSNREIGCSLMISVETVKEHVQNVLRKINASDRTQAAVWAVKRNLVD